MGNELKIHFVEFTYRYANFSPPLLKLGRYLRFHVASSILFTLGTRLEKKIFISCICSTHTIKRIQRETTLKYRVVTFLSVPRVFYLLHWLKTERLFAPSLTANVLMAIARHGKAGHPESHTWDWFRISREAAISCRVSFMMFKNQAIC